MQRLIALALLITLIGFTAPGPAPARAAGPTCEDSDYWGLCFDTLPKLVCCTAAFLGWSEIVVGDTFPVSGRVAQGPGQPHTAAIRIIFPSGKEVSIPVGADGTFHQVVSFDEEGAYRVAWGTGPETTEHVRFTVAYRTELIGLPTVEAQFGQQHARAGVTMAALPQEEPTTLRIRFTDAKGRPVRSRTLTLGRGYTTDADGVATVSYDPKASQQEYAMESLYPGLGLVVYRTATIDSDGAVRGLPGGQPTARQIDGAWYLPLRGFLEAASPLRFAISHEGILYDERTRTVSVEGLRIMLETGMVLGRPDFRANLKVIDGRTYMDLDSLLRLADQLGMAQRTCERSFRISMAWEP